MPMPEKLCYALNRAFQAVRDAEKEAARLEAEAQEARDAAQKDLQEVYNMLNRATIKLKETA
jgi:hypothetical protein